MPVFDGFHLVGAGKRKGKDGDQGGLGAKSLTLGRSEKRRISLVITWLCGGFLVSL